MDSALHAARSSIINPARTGRVTARALATLLVVLALPAGAQLAAGPATDELAEVIVTAQRRAESIQDVPIAVTAFSVADLQQRNVVKALDVMQYVPNVVAMNNVGLGSANAYYIRGLGSTDSLATQDAAVGTYVDDIYVARQSANNLSLFDVERVEVLRGPQGTLFGRNTTGGAVNIVLARPGEEVRGFVEAGTGSWSRVAFRGSVDLPVSERLLTKISVYWNEDDGYVRNTTTGERLNGGRNAGARLALRAKLTDALRWDFAGMYTENTAANVVNFTCDPRNPTNCNGRYVTTGLRVNNGGQNQITGLTAGVPAAPYELANGKGRLPLGAETRLSLASSNLGFELGGVSVAVITGYVRTEQDYLIDFFDGRAAPTLNFGLNTTTNLPTGYNVSNNVVLAPPVRGFSAGGFVITNIAKTDQFTQELKFDGELLDGRLDWTAGAFYFNERSDTDFADSLSSISATGVVSTTLLADRIVRNQTEAIAGYAQADYAFSEQWKFTAGVRYTKEDRDTAFSDNRPQCRVVPLPATCIDTANFASVDVDLNPATPNVTIPLQQSVELWTPRFVINYEPDDSLLFFASATRGFKSGAQAARATLVRQLLPVGPEKVWSYELGAKTEWLDRRLRLNVTAFKQENKDFQAGTGFVNPQTGALTFVTRNLADLDNQGVEIELLARPLDPLTLSVSLGYQDIKYSTSSDKPDVDSFGFLSPAAQLAECRAALAGQPSPLRFPGTAVARAQGNCSGIIRNDGTYADPVRSPELTAAVTAAWAFPVAGLGATLTPGISFLYTAEQEVGTNNLSGWLSASGVANTIRDGSFVLGSYSKAHWLYNANLTLAADDGKWSASLSCDNCADEAFSQSTLSNFTYLNAPRSWALNVRYRF